MKPVSGNWCWISGKRTDLRYALGHGWRFSIIFGTVGIYVYVWIYMRRHFIQLNNLNGGLSYGQGSAAKASKRRTFHRDNAIELRSESQTELHEINVEYRYEVKHSDGRSGTSLGKDDIESSVGDLERDDRRPSEITLSSPISPKSPYIKGSSGASSFPAAMRISFVRLQHLSAETCSFPHRLPPIRQKTKHRSSHARQYCTSPNLRSLRVWNHTSAQWRDSPPRSRARDQEDAAPKRIPSFVHHLVVTWYLQSSGGSCRTFELPVDYSTVLDAIYWAGQRYYVWI